MSTPYPYQQPRKLTRSTSNKLVGGVCGGVANYLNMDVNLVRIITVALTLFTGVPAVLYLIALFLLPEESVSPPQSVNGPQPQAGWTPYGASSAGVQTDTTWGSGGAPWEQPQATAPASAAPSSGTAPSSQPTSQTVGSTTSDPPSSAESTERPTPTP